MRSRWRKLLLLGLAGLVLFFAVPLPDRLAKPDQGLSVRLLDRHGTTLREVLSPRAGVETWVGLDQISPHFLAAMICSEDQRFYWHPGFDPLAVVRALRANWQAGQSVEGGSTITQQLVRNLLPERPRRLRAKLAESYWAIRLEAHLSKRRILECYLNRISFGNQCYGIESASRLYFSKPASELSLAQASFLAVIPRSPGSLDPYRDEQKETIEKLSSQLLSRMQD
ncbi:MAG: transglycosylase domain-containing protein, partial [Candidatus Eremiobacteraeota bacterium]|nr:transglycosylase domain-containing protein [Candidatus Eremiobacteraeota bacterium]